MSSLGKKSLPYWRDISMPLAKRSVRLASDLKQSMIIYRPTYLDLVSLIPQIVCFALLLQRLWSTISSFCFTWCHFFGLCDSPGFWDNFLCFKIFFSPFWMIHESFFCYNNSNKLHTSSIAPKHFSRINSSSTAFCIVILC